MRAVHLVLIGLLALLFGATSGCGGAKGTHAPPPFNKAMIVGKWQNSAQIKWIHAFEFAEDGTLRIALDGMEKPLQCKYTWSDDRRIGLEYPTAEADRKAYKEAVKSYKDRFLERAKTTGLMDRLAAGLTSIEDELPAKGTMNVAITEEPLLLIITEVDRGTSQTFTKMD